MSVLTKIFSSGAGELVKSVGGVIDNLTTSKEEKLEAERKIQDLVANYEVEMEKILLNDGKWICNPIHGLVKIYVH